jgi:hypothetical protein
MVVWSFGSRSERSLFIALRNEGVLSLFMSGINIRMYTTHSCFPSIRFEFLNNARKESSEIFWPSILKKLHPRPRVMSGPGFILISPVKMDLNHERLWVDHIFLNRALWAPGLRHHGSYHAKLPDY